MAEESSRIRFSGHALDQLSRRGATEGEVIQAVRGAEWEAADRGRLECRYNFAFDAEWNGTYYTTKQVRPIFVEEGSEIVIVTVYVYFF